MVRACEWWTPDDAERARADAELDPTLFGSARPNPRLRADRRTEWRLSAEGRRWGALVEETLARAPPLAPAARAQWAGVRTVDELWALGVWLDGRRVPVVEPVEAAVRACAAAGPSVVPAARPRFQHLDGDLAGSIFATGYAPR